MSYTYACAVEYSGIGTERDRVWLKQFTKDARVYFLNDVFRLAVTVGTPTGDVDLVTTYNSSFEIAMWEVRLLKEKAEKESYREMWLELEKEKCHPESGFVQKMMNECDLIQE